MPIDDSDILDQHHLDRKDFLGLLGTGTGLASGFGHLVTQTGGGLERNNRRKRPVTYTPPASHRVDMEIITNWSFFKGDVAGAQAVSFDDSSWTSLNLPHTWNNMDGQDGGNNYYRGIGWYRTHISVPPSFGGRKLFLQFDGANLVTDVYVNGQYVGEHRGGYSIFRFDITPYLHVGSSNVIAVKINNAFNRDAPPLGADFTFFGGLYRPVHLIAVDYVHLRMLDYGSSGVYITQRQVSASSATVDVKSELWNDSATARNVTLDVVLVDAAHRVVQRTRSAQTVSANNGVDVVQRITVQQPHLWDIVDAETRDPYLYRVYVEVRDGDTVIDVVSQPLGLRSFTIDPNKGFFLNGHYLDLHGVSRHQDRLNQGWAISNAEIEQDVSLILEIGALAVRGCHYEHAQHYYDLCDQMGLVVWAEIPVIDRVSTSTAFHDNAKQQLRELIRQNYNHPSIVVWGLANEITRIARLQPNEMLVELNALAHAEDPTRPTTMASAAVNNDATNWHTDLTAFNKYFGWYVGALSDFATWADTTHSQYPTKKLAVSEFGAGSSINYHSYTPTELDHTEEYQNLFHETHWQAMQTRPFLWAKFVWNMFDFASDVRDEGDTLGRNDKGLVTYDRQTKKDAFYWYKANWTTVPVVYITGRRFAQRTMTSNDVKVYANTDSVELIVNGTSHGQQTSPNHIFVWSNIALALGANTVTAIGTKDGKTYTDSVTWIMSPDTRIACGRRNAFTDAEGRYYSNDTYYSGGSSGTVANPISGTTEPESYQTYRSGTFSYNVPMDNGTYLLYLKFVEPVNTARGSRVFSVAAQGTTILPNLDIYSEAGQNTALQKTATVTVTAGTLALTFTPSTGDALVCSIAALKQ